MNLNIFALGFNNKLIQNKQVFDIVNEYLWQLKLYTGRYCYERYGLNVVTNYYYPFFTPKSYDELKAWDASGWRHEYFGDSLQAYIVYGLNLWPYGIDANGYCECFEGKIEPESMFYSEMQEYHPLLTRDPYTWWKEAGRTFFHELDHQILRIQKNPAWLKGVHKAMNLLLLEVQNGKDKFSRQTKFWIQQDARTI